MNTSLFLADALTGRLEGSVFARFFAKKAFVYTQNGLSEDLNKIASFVKESGRWGRLWTQLRPYGIMAGAVTGAAAGAHMAPPDPDAQFHGALAGMALGAAAPAATWGAARRSGGFLAGATQAAARGRRARRAARLTPPVAGRPANVPPGGANVPPGGANVPPGGANVPPGGANVPPGGANIPPGGANIPPGGANVPPGGANVPPGGANVPPGGGQAVGGQQTPAPGFLQQMDDWFRQSPNPYVRDYGSPAALAAMGYVGVDATGALIDRWIRPTPYRPRHY